MSFGRNHHIGKEICMKALWSWKYAPQIWHFWNMWQTSTTSQRWNFSHPQAPRVTKWISFSRQVLWSSQEVVLLLADSQKMKTMSQKSSLRIYFQLPNLKFRPTEIFLWMINIFFKKTLTWLLSHYAIHIFLKYHLLKNKKCIDFFFILRDRKSTKQQDN